MATMFWCCASLHIVEGDIHRGNVLKLMWEVDYVLWSPDCVEKVVIGINGAFPGPTIRGHEGDTLEVHVHNLLPTESVSIHWHGIQQVDTPWADGVAFVTQCAIASGETFIYSFKLEKAGTYSYYGFNGLQRSAGLYGMLIVEGNEKDPFEYGGEFNLLVSDWWHKSAYEQTTGLLAPLPQFQWVGEPQTLLINGRGSYDCALVPKGGLTSSGDVKVCNTSNPQCASPVMPVERGKMYRLRIASVASISSLNFVVEKHKLKVVEADGNYVEPAEVDDLDIYPGQSYSVLLNSNQFPGRNYWVALNVRGRAPQTPPHLTILNYFPVPPSTPPPMAPPTGPLWNDIAYSIAQNNLYKARKGDKQTVPTIVEQQIVFLTTQNFVNGKIKWAINNISLALPSTPYLQAFIYDLDDAYVDQSSATTYDQSYNISMPPENVNATMASSFYKLHFWHTIDVVLQNANTLFPGNSMIHPWHLHGHDFWIIGQGIGKFDPEKDPSNYNLQDPPLRNTVPLFPYGWVTLRFTANNIGAWLLHCNIEPHFLMGMGVVLEEGIHWLLDEPPSSTMGCGLTKLLMTGSSTLKL
ncbi:hypothetical protein GOP47_0025424 [Adiantum capillus-veneris]|uniref:L-ascorbate oxidase n=1 Tax=Adiantum capillus-veneris TaxID=13818 RepID=A0A9D4U0L2_ADICA|nr:hypothetical protein GOP47_0025424 [Adiantum capillus-veneris]